MKWFLSVAGVLLLFGFAEHVAARSQKAAQQIQQIDVEVSPLPSFLPGEPEKRRFGRLEYRGGIEVRSLHESFGGLSGLAVAPDGGSLLAVTDAGSWIGAQITYDGERLAGLGQVKVAPLLGPKGTPLATSGLRDAEALSVQGQVAFVGVERVQRIYRFDLRAGFGQGWGQRVPMALDLKDLPRNRGLEAVAQRADGVVVALSEEGLDEQGNLKAYMISGSRMEPFSVRRRDDFNVTDAVFLSNNDLVILERRFSFLSGLAMRLRRIPAAQVQAGQVVDGEVLLEAGMSYQIDNMEGLSVHKNGKGETLLTLVSDDNFSFLQRTIFLQFALLAD